MPMRSMLSGVFFIRLPPSSIPVPLPLLPLLECFPFSFSDLLLSFATLFLPLEIGFSFTLSRIIPTISLIVSTIPLVVPVPAPIPTIGNWRAVLRDEWLIEVIEARWLDDRLPDFRQTTVLEVAVPNASASGPIWRFTATAMPLLRTTSTMATLIFPRVGKHGSG